jgi:hypothetical protein
MRKALSRLLNWLMPVCACCLLTPCLTAAQNSSDEVGTGQHLSAGEEPFEEAAEVETPAGLEFTLLGRSIRLNGLAEFTAEYLDLDDLEDPHREDSSDVFISTLELALRMEFNDWSKAKVAVSAEDIGKNGEEGRVIMNEAAVTLEAPWLPLYLIAGQTQMPFGEFEDHLIEGTLTEEIYEIDDLGLILGFQPDLYGLDLSVAVYQDPMIVDNLTDVDLHEDAEDRSDDARFASYILRLAAEPLEEVVLGSLSYNSEPGDGRRNQSLGGALRVSLWRLTFDMELITALTREDGEDGRENKESAWVAGLAVELTEAIEIAGRYEGLNDDNSGGQDEVLDHRWVAGGNYAFNDWALFSLEYRYSKFEKEPDSDIEDQQHMVQVQLAFEF